jgi:pyruvate/2-oxoglutarate dehydrogenase complex dihydrolipoamide dehydrogenase (E3) component
MQAADALPDGEAKGRCEMTDATGAGERMEQVEQFDAIVIGSGQGANPLAKALASAGRDTAIIESTHVGGTCINEGCSPTKTMVASARVAYLARHGADYGVQTGPIAIDMKKVRARKQAIVDDFRSGGERGIAATEGLKLMRGVASFTGPHQVSVKLNAGASRALTADLIVVNTGCRPSIPKLPGLESVPYLTSTSIMELDAVPEHLIVLGAGYVGVEFGQMFRRFGSQVTMLQRGAKLLAREDDDVSDEVTKILREDGIDIQFGSETTSVAASPDGGVTVTVRDASGERQIRGSHLLVATGRAPNTELLNPRAAGVAIDAHGYITVNERLETNVPGVYAIGDVKGGPAFTHISYDDFRILRENLLHGGHATITGRLVPNVVFMDPQLGVVGMRESEARAVGRSIRVAKMPMTWVARALEMDETRGFMKAIVDADSQQILGCAILGVEGGEIMSALEMAMMGHLPYTTVKEAIFAHPTLTESLNNLFMSLDS